MKKILSIVLCLVLLMALIIPVSAEGTVKLTLKASKTKVYRGDTIDFTISASGGGTCQSYGFRMNINTDVFELVSSSVTDNNSKTVSQFSMDRGLAVGYSNPSVPSGTVCRFTLKVRDSAPLNSSHKLSGSASAKLDGAVVSASGSSVTINVACNHNYGDWKKSDDAKHERSCTACNNDETEKHTWNDGSVTKEPSCKEEGKTEYTCTKCGAKKSETLSKTDDHEMKNLTYVNSTSHQSVCSVCQKSIVSDHVWEMTNVLKKATCKEEGKATFQCTGCKEEKTETVPMSTKHTYDHGCDKDCNVCGLPRETEHKYKSAWTQDKQNHYHKCVHCGDKKDVAAHIPGPEPTEKKPQKCTVCGYVIKPALTHTHKFGDALVTDQTGHWYVCTGCDEKKDYTVHDFENDCDGLCETCGYTRETEHVTAQDWKSSPEGHSSYCEHCGMIEETFPHTPGEAATEFTAQVCAQCGYELNPAVGHTFGTEWIQGERTHYHVCQCGETDEELPHTWDMEEEFSQITYTCTVCRYEHTVQKDLLWLWILSAVAVAGIVAVVFLIVAIKKRRN